jgi:hypothetical protein
MNDLQYIFYDPKRMFLDTADMTAPGERAHRRLADFIWFSGEAPRNCDQRLCQITHTPAEDWPAVKCELGWKGWRVAGEFFLHRGTIESLNAARVRYAANFNRGCTMNRKPPMMVAEPDGVTGIIEVRAARRAKAAAGESPCPAPGNGSVLTAKGVPSLVGEIMRNATGWSYENCKVSPRMFVAKALVTGLMPYAERLPAATVLAAWDEAVKATHMAVVDGLVKSNVPGYCVASWRKLMDAKVKLKGQS